jgi:hypothetical protein
MQTWYKKLIYLFNSNFNNFKKFILLLKLILNHILILIYLTY